MAPNVSEEADLDTAEEQMEKLVAPQAGPRTYTIVYKNVLQLTFGHVSFIYGLYLAFTQASWATLAFSLVIYVIAGIGITAGAHRLWTHKAYKAKMPLQVLLMLMNCMAFQNTAGDWVRDHRLHHRYSDTDADPHNATRGFFYSHVGWLLVRKHREVKRRGKFIDMSDIYENPALKFQRKYAVPLISTLCFAIPTLIPMYFWEESFIVAWHVNMTRYILNLHGTFLVNSATHLWGYRPYDQHMKPTQNIPVAIMSLGEGFHNYHHVYPYDYRTAELGNNKLNLTTMFIDFFAWIGWAYDLRSPLDEVIQQRADRTGDGTDLWGFRKGVDEVNLDKEL